MISIKIKGIGAGFILGILVGAAIMNLITGSRIDQSELEIRKLRVELIEQTEQLANMEKKLAVKNKITVVEDIDVHVLYKDEFEKLEIAAAVEKLLGSIKGKEVKGLDPLLIANIVDARTIATANHKYILTVKGALISEAILIYVEAREIVEQTI